MRTQLKDKQAIAQCETSLMESQKRLDFLNNELAKLTLKKQQRESGGSGGAYDFSTFTGQGAVESSTLPRDETVTAYMLKGAQSAVMARRYTDLGTTSCICS
jgi:hypothetical protein